MRKATAALASVLVLVLTGCAGTPESAPNGTAAPQESVTPLAAEPDTKPAGEEAGTDEQYLTDVRKALTNGRETSIPNASDEQLIQAGHDACEQIANGTAEPDVRVIEGEPFDENWGAYQDSAIILTIAQGIYC